MDQNSPSDTSNQKTQFRTVRRQVSGQLQIECPGEGDWRIIVAIAMLAVVLLWFLAQVQFMPRIIFYTGTWLWLAMVFRFLWFTLPTILVFRHQRFSIYKLFYKLPLVIVDEAIANIQEIVVVHTHNARFTNTRNNSIVKIRLLTAIPWWRATLANSDPWFGQNLSESECDWLVQEIQQWLDQN